MPVKAYTRFGPLVAREVGEEQLDFDEVPHNDDDDCEEEAEDGDDVSLGQPSDHIWGEKSA